MAISKSPRPWRTIIIVFTSTVAVFAGLIAFALWTGSTEPILKVANQFKPESTWILRDETITPPRTICLDGTCPSVHRHWEMGKTITKTEFENLFKHSGWNFVIEGDCAVPADMTGGGGMTVCEARGKVDQFNVYAYVTAVIDKPEESELSLVVE